MSQHVYIRLHGYSLVVTPRAPYQILRTRDAGELTAGAADIDVEYFTQDKTLFARLIPDLSGGYRSKIDQVTPSIYDVFDVEAGSQTGDWEIETSVYACGWPAGYSIVSNHFPRDPGPFDLKGPGGELIYFQTPAQAPDVTKLQAPGQQIVRLDRTPAANSIVLGYQMDGESWRLCHMVFKAVHRDVVCTAQSPAASSEACFDVCRQLATSFRWIPPDA